MFTPIISKQSLGESFSGISTRLNAQKFWALILPIAFYDAEAWTLRSHETQSLEVFEIRCLCEIRCLWAIRLITRADISQNIRIRDNTFTKDSCGLVCQDVLSLTKHSSNISQGSGREKNQRRDGLTRSEVSSRCYNVTRHNEKRMEVYNLPKGQCAISVLPKV